jgi:autotransporter-associated beta strand protein
MRLSKGKKYAVAALAMATFAGGHVEISHASVWDGVSSSPGQNGKWGTGSKQNENWTNDTTPNSAGAQADFDTTAASTDRVVAVANNITAGILNFNVSAGNGYSLTTGTLNLDASAGNAQINIAATNTITNTISATLSLVDNLAIGFSTGTSQLTLSGAIGQATSGKTLTVSGSNAFTLVLSGSGANSYSGLTTVNGGTLSLNKTGVNAIAGDLTIGDGTGTDVATLAASNQIVDTVLVTIASSGRLNLNGQTETIGSLTSSGILAGTGTLTVTGNVTANTGATFTGSPNVTLAPAANTTRQLLGSLTSWTGLSTLTVSGGNSASTIDINGKTLSVATLTLTTGVISDVATGGKIAASTAINTQSGSISAVLDGGAPLTSTGTVFLSGNNSYTGGTAVTSGTLRINNTSGSGTGTNAITVSNGATLGGNGTITTTVANTGVTVAVGGKLSPGAGDATAGILTMSFNGTGKLDISAAVAASNTKALVFDLNGLATDNSSDKIVISNGDANVANASLAIGSGSTALEWNDFDFRGWNNLASGSYVLFDTSETISGSFGSVVSGNLGWATGTIGFADSSNQDIVLNLIVTPEPGSMGLLSMLWLPALLKRRRRVL